MSSALAFVQAAGEPLQRARTKVEEAIAGLDAGEAFLQLRVDFEEILVEDHAVSDRARAVIFAPLESLPTMEARLEQLVHMASSYIVAREFGLVQPSSTAHES